MTSTWTRATEEDFCITRRVIETYTSEQLEEHGVFNLPTQDDVDPLITPPTSAFRKKKYPYTKAFGHADGGTTLKVQTLLEANRFVAKWHIETATFVRKFKIYPAHAEEDLLLWIARSGTSHNQGNARSDVYRDLKVLDIALGTNYHEQVTLDKKNLYLTPIHGDWRFLPWQCTKKKECIACPRELKRLGLTP